MRPRYYTILERAVEEGVRVGRARAFKYTETPTEEAVIQSITDAVMFSIGEVFLFEGES